MQRVAFDPLAKVDKPTQCPELTPHGEAEGRLHRVDSAHLVGDRANTIDAGGYIRGLAVAATAQQGFEKAWRFEDFQPNFWCLTLPQPYYQPALALDAGKVINLDLLATHVFHFLCEKLLHRR